MIDPNGQVKNNYELQYFSFSPTQYESIYNKDGSLKQALYHQSSYTPLTTFFESNEVYRPVDIVTKTNVTKFYRPEAPAGTLVKITSDDTNK